MSHFHGSVAGAHVHGNGTYGADPVIVSVSPGTVSAVVTYTGGATEYRVNAGAPAAIGSSPATITGLTAGTAYSLQLRGGSGVWSAAVDFGTINPADGGGELPLLVSASEETDVAVPLPRALRRGLGTALETSSAQALSVTSAVMYAGDTSSALARAGVLINGSALAAETDAALPLSRRAVLSTGPASDTSSARGLQLYVPGGVAVSTEVDAALALSALLRRGAMLATSAESAVAVAVGAGAPVAVASEISEALALGRSITRVVARASDLSLALALHMPASSTSTFYAISAYALGTSLRASAPDLRVSGYGLAKQYTI